MAIVREVQVLIQGVKRTARVGLNALCALEELRADGKMEGVTSNIRSIVYVALQDGARVHGEDRTFTLADVGDWMEQADDSETWGSDIMALIIKAMPEAEESDGPDAGPSEPPVVDPAPAAGG